MRPAVRIAAALFLAGLACAALSGLAQPVSAEEREKPKTRRVLPIRKSAFTALNKAHKAIEKQDWPGALGALDGLAKRKGNNAHERALMFQAYGYVHSGRDEYLDASRAFEQAIATGALSYPAELSTLYNTGQLYIAVGQPERGIEILLRWLGRAENPAASAYILIAQAHLQIEDFDGALRYIELGLAKADAPEESWLQIAASLYFQKQDYEAVAKVLEQLVSRFPNKEYWLQLAAAYGELEQDKRSLASLEAAYRQDLLDRNNELVQLAQLYLYYDAPYLAARVLERGIESGVVEGSSENWELLANSWISGREYERALEPLGMAAQRSDDGDLWVRLGQVCVERDLWQRAADALGAAFRIGDLSEPGTAHLLLGIANFHLGRLDSAERSFDRARNYEEARHSAGQWLRHVAGARERAS